MMLSLFIIGFGWVGKSTNKNSYVVTIEAPQTLNNKFNLVIFRLGGRCCLGKGFLGSSEL